MMSTVMLNLSERLRFWMVLAWPPVGRPGHRVCVELVNKVQSFNSILLVVVFILRASGCVYLQFSVTQDVKF